MYKPELRDDIGSEMAFEIGHEVGELTQRLFDENGDGNLIDAKEMGWPEAYAQIQELLKSSETPIFEATMRIEGHSHWRTLCSQICHRARFTGK